MGREVGHAERLVGVDQVEAVMRRPAPGPRRLALAVPMSRPRKTWRESAEMTAAGRPVAMSASASRIASSVLPVAVAPATTTSGGAPAVRRSRADERASQRVRAGVVDADEDLATDERRVAGEVDELVAAGPAGQPARARLATDARVVGRRVAVVPVGACRLDRIDEDLDLPPEPRLVALEPDRLLDARAAC